jgi:hypothetical protein
VTGKAYYITTLADWQRHAPRFANSHFIILDAPDSCSAGVSPASIPAADSWRDAGHSATSPDASAHVECGGLPPLSYAGACSGAPAPAISASESQQASPADGGVEALYSAGAAIRILVLIEADEGVHLSLEDEPAFEPLPHPLAQKPISDAAQSALAPHGVAPGATTFDAAEALARMHPLLKHRVF